MSGISLVYPWWERQERKSFRMWRNQIGRERREEGGGGGGKLAYTIELAPGPKRLPFRPDTSLETSEYQPVQTWATKNMRLGAASRGWPRVGSPAFSLPLLQS